MPELMWYEKPTTKTNNRVSEDKNGDGTTIDVHVTITACEVEGLLHTSSL